MAERKKLRPAPTSKSRTAPVFDSFVPVGVTVADEPSIIDAFVGSRVVIARQEAGLTKAGAAAKLGVSRTTYHRWEVGFSGLTVGNLYAVAQLVSKPVSWFFEGLDGLLEHAAGDEEIDGLVTSESMQVLRYFALLDPDQQRAMKTLMLGCVEGISSRVGLSVTDPDDGT